MRQNYIIQCSQTGNTICASNISRKFSTFWLRSVSKRLVFVATVMVCLGSSHINQNYINNLPFSSILIGWSIFFSQSECLKPASQIGFDSKLEGPTDSCLFFYVPRKNKSIFFCKNDLGHFQLMHNPLVPNQRGYGSVEDKDVSWPKRT